MFARALHERGLKMSLNEHPHAAFARHEEVCRELARVLGHDTSYRSPIQFDASSPRFLQALFSVVHRRLEEQGCDFWWIDWEQDSHSHTPDLDPLLLLNHFQFLDTKHTNHDSYPIIFSRYGGPGRHRYPVAFLRTPWPRGILFNASLNLQQLLPTSDTVGEAMTLKDIIQAIGTMSA